LWKEARRPEQSVQTQEDPQWRQAPQVPLLPKAVHPAVQHEAAHQDAQDRAPQRREPRPRRRLRLRRGRPRGGAGGPHVPQEHGALHGGAGPQHDPVRPEIGPQNDGD